MKSLGILATTFLFILTACSGYKNAGTNEASLPSCNGFALNSFGQQLYWQPKFPIKIAINESVPDSYRGAIDRALKHWNDAANFEIFILESNINRSTDPKEDGSNVIYWRLNWDKVKSDLQASTNLYWTNQETREADILLNAQNFKITDNPKEDEIDLESLLVHELGHILGLGHVDSKDSVMISKLAFGEKRRQPFESDLKNLSCRY